MSMRSLAKELDTGPASLYAHVANREELDQLIVERIASSMRSPSPTRSGGRSSSRSVIETLAAYREHPGAARAAMGMVPTKVGGLRNADGIMAMCMAGGT